MFWTPPHHSRRKPWWDTGLSRLYGASGLAAKLWFDHLFPRLIPSAANDRDHWQW